MLQVTIPIITVSEMNWRGHYMVRARRVKLHRSTAWRMLATSSQKPTVPCVVTLTRIGRRDLDDDNLRSALKACRDGIADWLKIDDADPRVSWRYAQRRPASKADAGVVVAIDIC